MKNRRNYYRLLRVQPDASLEIIKHSYRTLMQKLHHHPDLGGEEWNASNINMAYATLRDTKKRAAYDRKLFSQHDIETLSRGNLGKTAKAFKTKQKQSANQRNYYRLLQVQPDAELAVIEASYKLLKCRPDANKALLDEAWKALHSEVKRRQYDQQLKGAKITNNSNGAEHPESLPPVSNTGQAPRKRGSAWHPKHQRPKQNPEQHGESSKPRHSKAKAQQKKHTTSPSTKTKQTNDQSTSSTSTNQTNANKHKQHQDRGHAYSAQNGQYCLFCHTPYSHNDYTHRHEYCDECCSPLLLLSAGFSKLPRRHIARTKAQKPAVIYSSWPSKPSRIALADLSPTGLSFINKRPLIVGNLIKIDAEEFKAIAELRYCKAIGAFSKIGVHFITIQFSQQRGAFLSTSA